MIIDDETTEDFIAHFGVKGMKWGIRKDRRSGGGSKSKKTKVSDLSDDDLRKKVNRLNMEKQYKSLKQSERDQKAVRRGAKFVGGILTKAAKRSLTDFTADQMAKALKKAVERPARATGAT